MQWPVCSKSDSRKIPANAAFVLFFFTAAFLPAQIEHETALSATAEYLSVSMTVAGADVESLFATLHDGMRVRIAGGGS